MNGRRCITDGTLGLTEEHPNHYAIDASMLGLKPGHWPVLLDTTLGNGCPFVFAEYHMVRGDLTHVTYRQGELVLEVFNT